MAHFPHILFAAKTDVGRKRRNNEDAYGVFHEAGLFCVADGMGGGDDGEVASAATIRAVEQFASSNPHPAECAYDIHDYIAALERRMNDASKWILDRATEKNLKGCGSTFVAFCLDAGKPAEAVALHAGDSRLYRVRGRAIAQITRDHSAAALMGVKNEDEVNPMFRGMILRAVGVMPTVDIDKTKFDVRTGDRLLLCSDGLYRMVPERKVASVIRNAETPQRAVDELIEMANAAGGVDNITAVVVYIGNLPEPLRVVAMRQSRGVQHGGRDTESRDTVGTEDASGPVSQEADVTKTSQTNSSSGSYSLTDSALNSVEPSAMRGTNAQVMREGVMPGTADRERNVRLSVSKCIVAALLLLATVVWFATSGGIRKKEGESRTDGKQTQEESRQTLEETEKDKLAQRVEQERLARLAAEKRLNDENCLLDEAEKVASRNEWTRMVDILGGVKGLTPENLDRIRGLKERRRLARKGELRSALVDKVNGLIANEPVADRKVRLDAAEDALRCAAEENPETGGPVFTRDEVRNKLDDIAARRKWIVGKVANNTDFAVRVNGRSIMPGGQELFVFKSGMPSHWSASAVGYDEKALEVDFDGRVLSLEKGEFRQRAVTMVLPALDDGVECICGGKMVVDFVKLRPGTGYTCSYTRPGYEKQTVRFAVKFNEDGVLPQPGLWNALPVEVTVPEMLVPESVDEIKCKVDGVEVHSGEKMKFLPGRKYAVEYICLDYKPQSFVLTVEPGKSVKMPGPEALEPTEGLKALAAAEAALRDGNWDAVARELQKADVFSSKAMDRKNSVSSVLKRHNAEVANAAASEVRRRRDEAIAKLRAACDNESVSKFERSVKGQGLMHQEWISGVLIAAKSLRQSPQSGVDAAVGELLSLFGHPDLEKKVNVLLKYAEADSVNREISEEKRRSHIGKTRKYSDFAKHLRKLGDLKAESPGEVSIDEMNAVAEIIMNMPVWLDTDFDTNRK